MRRLVIVAINLDVRRVSLRLSAALAGLPRFVDNLDGTITDHRTGFMWEKKVAADFVDDAGNLHDADNTFRWTGRCSFASSLCQPDSAASSACLAGAEGPTGGCSAWSMGTCDVNFPGSTVREWVADLNAAGFAGHNDWRLPTRRELESILDPTDTTAPRTDPAFDGGSCGPGCTDITVPGCSCTPETSMWSATAVFGDPSQAWSVDFAFAGNNFLSTYDDAALRVRAVRDIP